MSQLFFYDSKVYLFVYDEDDYRKTTFFIWNEAEIPTLTSASIQMRIIENTRDYYNLGVVKGEAASNYFLMAFYDDDDEKTTIAMFEPTVVSGVNSLNMLWRSKIFGNL